MTTAKRSILSLSKQKVDGTSGDQEELAIPVGLYDVLLPSRQFVVRHKVAVLGEVSLTTEFLLRLLHSIDGMDEQDACSFFGFDATEMAFVVNEAESRAYVVRQDGRIWLTDAGYALFKDGDKPQIFEVQKCTDRVGFDLLALAPCDRENLSDFERALPELEVRDAEIASSAAGKVPEAFRRFYSEIASRKDRDVATGLRRSLYSVDEVEAADRFSSVVPVLAVANVRKPGDPEPVLDAWRSGHEVADRGSVVNSVAAFLDSQKAVRRSEDDSAYQTLIDLAPEYLKEYITRDGLSVLRFFKETAARAGELRADRATVGIVGPLFSPDNSKRVLSAINHAASRTNGDDETLLWVLPASATWGASRALGTFLEKITNENICTATGDARSERLAIALTCGKPSKHLAKVFQTVLLRPNNGSIPSALEMLIIPQRMVAVTVHAPVGSGRGFPVPLGVLSFDANVVRRAHAYLEAQLPRNVETFGPGAAFDLRDVLHWSDGNSSPGDGGVVNPS
jgi:hypothetical protein